MWFFSPRGDLSPGSYVESHISAVGRANMETLFFQASLLYEFVSERTSLGQIFSKPKFPGMANQIRGAVAPDKLSAPVKQQAVMLGR